MRKFLGSVALKLSRTVLDLGLVTLTRIRPARDTVLNAVRTSTKLGNALQHLGILIQGTSSDSSYLKLSNEWTLRERRGTLPEVTLVIPVFNAFDEVKQCLAAIAENAPPFASVLVLNDSSTDERIVELLDNYAELERWKIVHNPVNLGYTRNVNKGISLAAKDSDVLLLNSDTVPLGNWISKLRYAAYRDPSIGTVTPFSDNSDAFSIPRIGIQNLPPKNWSLQDFALAVEQSGCGDFLDVPTGNGFCFYIKRQVLDGIGAFDEELFPRGYGEENEFSMRALSAGWKNVVSDKVFVSHIGSKSFLGEKTDLIAEGVRRVISAYPEYELLTQKFFQPKFQAARQRVFSRLELNRKPLKRILFVMPVIGGGLPLTNEDLCDGLEGKLEIFRLELDPSAGLRVAARHGKAWVLIENRTARLVNLVDPFSVEFDSWFAELCFELSIDVVHVEHFQFLSPRIPLICKSMQIPVTFSVHDYYSICPSTQLLDSNGVFCGGKCTPENGEDCQTQVGLVSPLPKLKNNYIYSWQSKMSQVIDTVDAIFAPSMAASKRLQSVYPQAGSKTQVVEHGRSDLVDLGIPSVKYSNLPQKKLIVIGHIGDHKGAKLLSQIIEPLDSLGVTVEVLGSVNWRLQGKVKVLGEYSREELPALVNKGGYSAALFLSIWEETYAHTLTEAWAAGIPTISLDLGAIGERTKATGNGVALSPDLIDSPREFAREVTAVLDDHPLQAKLKANLAVWSRTGVPSTKEMAKHYLVTWMGLLSR